MPSGSPRPDQAGPSRRLISLLALTCGVGVAGIYFPQAISPLIADDLGVSRGAAAAVVTAAQFGYATGVFLLVPLGDRLAHRRLVVTLLAVTAAGLLVAGLATALPLLLAASVLIGVATVVPQIIIPMAAGLVPERRRGAVTGTLLSGLIGGILLARSFSGGLGQWLGWRAPYLVAAAVVVLLAVVLAFAAPATTPSSTERYPALLATTIRLLRTEPDLRRSGLYQALVFAGFSAAWTSLALLVTGPAYGMGASAVGVIALVGAASMFATPIAGRLADRHGSDPVGLVCMLGTVAAAALLTTGGLGGVPGLVGVTLALLLLDVAVQAGQVANQARIFALRPEARSRLNTAYMTCSFLGGSAGSWLGVRAYTGLGWNGVCLLVAVLAVLALARHLVAMRRGSAVGAGGLAGGVQGVEERA
ncbi:MFS transporter [Actinomadura sp. NEAU-AAG7]|uniref:MFS transporter n=1 Tax=Actinomadura sp. NEAU-AAG7 TaxID=2839640 RepID=UPI001BE40056|nr:MFS transporter [Actinomadura sp. NEAU-AAG7]MBT2208244.1 MFS transporter [Actinomadura sp. NEAU-AAG7]